MPRSNEELIYEHALLFMRRRATFAGWTHTPDKWSFVAPRFDLAVVTRRPQAMDERDVDFAVFDLADNETAVSRNMDLLLRDRPVVAVSIPRNWYKANSHELLVRFEAEGWRRIGRVARFYLMRTIRRRESE